jgi:hypothetical protein
MRPLLALCVLGACAALAACGSSGGASSTSVGKAGGPGSGRFTALRSCLQKQGIALPALPSRATRPQGGPGVGAPAGRPRGLQPPKGVSQAQLQAALKKCAANRLPRGAFPGGARGGAPPAG